MDNRISEIERRRLGARGNTPLLITAVEFKCAREITPILDLLAVGILPGETCHASRGITLAVLYAFFPAI